MSAVAWDLDTATPTARRPHLRLVPELGAPASAPVVRLTRRGRLLRAALVAVVMAALALGLVAYVGGSATAQQQITVEPGQTLSEIAAVQLPDASIADGVVRLQVANNLTSAQVTAGQRLVIPR
ncbi:LysM peptidoglycan-binding domain-containing protein [Kribbia dieselivorans]|uniref:LysM peptidoglycan-binding domain-containing protein n=1 Tax=Kribbia dieselivorans TaxID=331526 RepID=UPI000838862C|nr:LysM peptidoglycan-binding domain-containing protein [Kribbia dieselivorans]